jgi:hypothetical protein
VTLRNIEPTELLIQARKIGEKAVFIKIPQQSDYVAHWQANKPVPVGSRINDVRKWMDIYARRMIASIIGARRNKLYSPVKLRNLTRHPQ